MAEFIYTMHNVRKAVGDKVILDNVTLSFFPGAKIGVFHGLGHLFQIGRASCRERV